MILAVGLPAISLVTGIDRSSDGQSQAVHAASDDKDGLLVTRKARVEQRRSENVESSLSDSMDAAETADGVDGADAADSVGAQSQRESTRRRLLRLLRPRCLQR